MKKRKFLPAAVLALLALVSNAFATPSTVYWTPCTTYFQPFLKGHIGYDSYIRDKSGLSNDYGFTIGVLPFKEVQAEIGYGAIVPAAGGLKDGSYFNAKIGLPENTLLPVGLQAGIFNAGLTPGVSDYNVMYAVIGRTFENIGTFVAGGYYGNEALLYNDNGNPNNSGVMLSYTSPTLGKVILVADVMSGNNALSAWGIGVYYYFADNVTLLTGPIFPLSKQFAGSSDLMWTLQLDVDFDVTSSVVK